MRVASGTKSTNVLRRSPHTALCSSSLQLILNAAACSSRGRIGETKRTIAGTPVKKYVLWLLAAALAFLAAAIYYLRTRDVSIAAVAFGTFCALMGLLGRARDRSH